MSSAAKVKEGVLFRKKEPKNFCLFGAAPFAQPTHLWQRASRKSFLVLFFKKEHSSCLRSRPSAGKFSALDTAAKLNAITDVPHRTMAHDSDRPGERGLLTGKGLADSRRTPG